jgi:transcriptional antiterminator
MTKTQYLIPNTELTMGQLTRLLGIRERSIRRHLHRVDPSVSTHAENNHELVTLDTLIALRDQSASNGHLARKLDQIIRDNSP